MDISPLARAVIKRGTILHSDEFDYVDHGKMFVVMGEDDTQLYGFFFINSDHYCPVKAGKSVFEIVET